LKRIKLTHKKVALVDDDWYPYLSQFRWQARYDRTTGKWYAARQLDRRFIYMHREILNAPDGLYADHRNGQSLDNRQKNLRLATSAQNAWNRDKYKNNTTGYKGVTCDKGRRKWRAQLTVHGKHMHLGWYDDPGEAALAYDQAARKYHGPFGCTNFKEMRK
jgi:hypothetical protein